MEVLQTDRLRLREMTAADAAFMLDLLNQPAFLRNIGDRGVRTLDDARNYIVDGAVASYRRYGFGSYLVEEKLTGAPTGTCGLLKRETLEDVDIGFAFLPAYWGKGYATESATAVMAMGRNGFGLQRIVGIVAPHNQASMKVLEKIGLTFEKMVTLAGDDEAIKLYS
ncbi:GNAT family N-acetyltransferase [Exilibacterium tricleocarpae]|uniref:GNAT family N-acetyltransferase n=1 Tax=Exilibacterium tricleocarpae TaxID=2591008 RepID=A0A545TFV5_9GAMM|nr:GNAT family N-acetyltransferase [Exilibacterium tricleocarpae]TQV76061.1 GNAT family N-acetyltransferase [Exilibacterium tricleocarpae]